MPTRTDIESTGSEEGRPRAASADAPPARAERRSRPRPAPIDSAESAASRASARVARIALLIATDLSALIAAGVSAYLLWALPVKGQPIALYLNLAPLVALFLFGYAQAGLYPGFGLGPVETLRRLSYVTAFGFLVLAAFSFALKLDPLYSRVTFAIACALSLATVPLARVTVRAIAGPARWWNEPVVIVGTGARAARAVRAIQDSVGLGYRPSAVLALRPEAVSAHVESVPVRGGIDAAADLAAQGIRVALLETEQVFDPVTVDRLQRHFRHVILLREFDDLPVEGIQVRNLGGVVGIEYTNNLLLHYNRVVKRALDVAIASVSLVLAAPLILFAVLLVKLLDRGPAFFTQNRTGLDGRRIAVPKIRTMRNDAERQLEAHLAANPDMREEWEANFKLKSDPRLIPLVGRFFRRFSVDELPQLWAVVRGDMSLVGPRPFPDYHMKKFSPAFRELRQRVRPGITGLWQIMVRSEGGVEQQEAFDTYYIRNWSVWLDVYVLARTFATVLTGRGAY
jgi:Undecaprenyl-phosphate galactose phosphotransferase WbaP